MHLDGQDVLADAEVVDGQDERTFLGGVADGAAGDVVAGGDDAVVHAQPEDGLAVEIEHRAVVKDGVELERGAVRVAVELEARAEEVTHRTERQAACSSGQGARRPRHKERAAGGPGYRRRPGSSSPAPGRRRPANSARCRHRDDVDGCVGGDARHRAPVGDAPVVLARIDQLERRPAAVGGGGPGGARLERHSVDRLLAAAGCGAQRRWCRRPRPVR